MTVDGVPNELYAQNMEYRHQYDEIIKHFGEGQLKDAGAIQKDLQLHEVNIVSYYTDKYGLWLDFRTMDDYRLHCSGRRLESTSEGIRKPKNYWPISQKITGLFPFSRCFPR